MGSPRAVFIPVIAMPLSLVGTFGMMIAFGFSINLLTLLAIVLAIGLVVDDAIIVVENVTRHLEEGMTPFDAAILAARELGGPIIAMTVVLVAVYVPIGFQGGLTGALFVEFALTLVFACIILVSIVFLYRAAQSELAPTEDQSFLLTSATLASNSTREQADLYAKQIRDIAMKHPELQHVFQVMAPNNLFAGLVLK